MIRRAGLVAVLLLGACSRPDWTDPERSKGPHGPPPGLAAPLPSVPHTADPAPPLPPWAAGLMGKPLRQVFPGTGVCQGNTDNVIRVFQGKPPGIAIAGWGWDVAGQVHIGRVLLVTVDGHIAGAGDGGRRRSDVPRAVPSITALDTGWRAVTPRVTGLLNAFGIAADGKSVCPLGQIEF